MNLAKRQRGKESEIKVFRQLKAERVKQNLTRQDLAYIVGYHWTLIGRWERGEAVPSIRRLLDWAQALGCELSLKKPPC